MNGRLTGRRLTAVVVATLLAVAHLAFSMAPSNHDNAVQARGDVLEGMGVNVHHLEAPAQELAAIRSAGARWVRMDLAWAKMEPKPGQYEWADADARMAQVRAQGLKPILILAYGNPVYAPPPTGAARAFGDRLPPQSDKAVSAYADWAAAVAARYGSDAVLELWNEPNTEGFWRPAPDADSYIRMATRACSTIRKARPDAVIWGPALANKDAGERAYNSAFLRRVVASPLPACLSAISVHPYVFWGSIDSLPDFWQRTRATVAAAGKPLVSSESGISNYAAHVTANTQASYLVRMRLYDYFSGVPVTIWYDWKNDGSDRSSPEQNYGLVDSWGNAKPALTALQVMNQQLAGRSRQCMIKDGQQVAIYAWSPGNEADQLVVAWNRTWGLTPSVASSVVLALPGAQDAPSIVDLFGQPVPRATKDGEQWRVWAEASPIYVRYHGARPVACH
ncbi:cellulase family glycosylhydrolase [Novosphingobium sp. NBM11]|uniref:cellulase family glycosylhydrolase n=1 Tax=Novosphingobium sp. NBM11 TaxID=2596914 RepID=UPI0018924843|nr:cellulase family glycosylhydrolase [Novosphingobium sp. NBM11]MBF5091556.1 cellulase family glycosylhydrolase [Novosphingobium sp. NBM11]